jgi:hypothetical protein
LEVLISIGVLTIGLLGVLSVIPLGQMTVAESIRADHAGNCGRAAMRDIKVQRLLDFRSWYWERDIWGYGYEPGMGIPVAIPEPDQPNTTLVPPYPNGFLIVNQNNPPCDLNPSFLIDPLGRTKGLPSILYGLQGAGIAKSSFLPRRTLSAAYLRYNPPPPARGVINGSRFYWPDDLSFETTEGSIDRPFINPNPNITIDVLRSMNYSCFFTITPSTSDRNNRIPNRRLFDVTVAVCFQRNLDIDANGYPQGEWVADVLSIGGLAANDVGVTPPNPPSVSPGGGTISLGRNPAYNVTNDGININDYGTAANPISVYRIRGDALNGCAPNPAMNLTNNIPPLKENRWVMLWDRADGRLEWYRVVGVGLDATPPTLTLDGPDWYVTSTTKLIVIDGVIGTYKTTIELDYDALWGGM